MGRKRLKVISASRRTDIPAFYLEWFMAGIDAGSFEVTNPYNGVKRRVEATPDTVHTIVFWSKNYRPFLEAGAGRVLKKMGFHLFFNFTVNSGSSLLEPGVPGLDDRLDQLERLSREFGPETVSWRFDPICFFRTGRGRVENNLGDFTRIAQWAGQCGIQRCITSFVDDYAKIRTRLERLRKDGHPAVALVDPGMEKKREILLRMEKVLDTSGIRLHTCCERPLFATLPETSGIRESACIPGKLLAKLFGGHPVQARDYGQRSKQGCSCTQSVDIGSYGIHPCYHNCLFCYANPAMDRELQRK
ncbi:MAG: DUF1848 domain-containing protein [Desulfobacteraceae bacterium]|nr:DUF1848 domain-containing protein [Desulfobacteraceae bacterium]